MKHGESLVRHIASTLLDERSDELSSLGRDLELISHYADNPYPIMRYDEAIETLQKKGVDVEWGQDLDYSKEKILTADFSVPHFLTHTASQSFTLDSRPHTFLWIRSLLHSLL